MLSKLNVVISPIIPALQRLRQEDYKFKPSLGQTARPCLKTNNKKIMSNWESILFIKRAHDCYFSRNSHLVSPLFPTPKILTALNASQFSPSPHHLLQCQAMLGNQQKEGNGLDKLESSTLVQSTTKVDPVIIPVSEILWLGKESQQKSFTFRLKLRKILT